MCGAVVQASAGVGAGADVLADAATAAHVAGVGRTRAQHGQTAAARFVAAILLRAE